jgi:cytochrome c oxidase assembly factor 5
MTSSCHELVDELAKCIRASPCMAAGKDFHKCVRSTDEAEISAECARIRGLYSECKRSQLDMRKRFRGNPGYVPPSS